MNETDGRMDAIDDDILTHIAEMFDAIDPPRDDLADEILFAMSLAALDAELASLEDASVPALRTDSARPTDTVTFTSSALQLMVSATHLADGLRIDAWITGGGLRVDLISGATSHPATSDANGRIVWQGIPPGPLRFLMHPNDEESRPVLTPVIEL